jgi:4-amino-4-deoxy-L-arabinose transferase-like glycosyltransferase
VERFGISFPGSVAAFGGGGGGGARVAEPPTELGGAPTTTAPGGVRYNAGGFLGLSGGWTKLIGSRFGPEIGWLYPLALLALIAGLAWRGRAKRTDPMRAGLVMWGLWLVTFGLIYSKMSNIPHTAYMASLGPPLAALSGTGIVLFWRWYRDGSRAWWLLPLAIAVQVAWAWYLWSGFRGFLPWLMPVATVAGGIAIVVLVTARLPRIRRLSGRRLLTAGAAAGAVGVAAMLAAPTAWSASVLDLKYAGSSLDASAGPAGGFGPGGGGGFRGGTRGDRPAEAFRRFREEGQAGGPVSSPVNGSAPGGDVPGGGAVPGGGDFPREGFPGGGSGTGGAPGGAGGGILGSTSTTLTSGEEALYQYLTAHRDGATYLFAVQGWTSAAPYILATGQQVLPMGGFSGSVPEPTLARVKQLVATGKLRYFMLSGAGGFGGGGFGGAGRGGSTSSTSQIAAWVQSACHTVQVSGADSAGTLYQCGTS